MFPKNNARTIRQANGTINAPAAGNIALLGGNHYNNNPAAARRRDRDRPMDPPAMIPPARAAPAGAPPPPPSSHYFTAPENWEDVEATQQEDMNAGSQDPFEQLFGRLVPCNPALEAFDLFRAKPVAYIGRNPNNDYMLGAPKISGKHCEIRLMKESDGKETVSITDLSSNGTFIMGQRIGKGRHHRLAHGDEICLGVPISSLDHDDFRFIFRLSSQPITSGAGIHTQYQLDEVLGTGSFAIVKRCYSKINRETFACKILAKSKLRHNPKQKEYFERELSILQTLRHHNITKLVEYFEDEATIFIVMEFCAGGDLLGYIQRSGPVGEPLAKEWARQMMEALSYTHRKGISHRDLKPENILLTSDNPPKIKVADFGLAKQVTGGTFLHTMCGTPQYLAPEVVTGGPGSGYDSKVDAYSLGVIIWCMMTNVTCFGQEDESQSWQVRMAQRQVDWDILRSQGVSETCEEFLRRLIVHDPRDRMSVHDALNHAWIANIENPQPEGWMSSQSQSQSQSQHSNGPRDSQVSGISVPSQQRDGTPSEGITSSTTDPYNFDPVVGMDADGNDRWRAARSPAVDELDSMVDSRNGHSTVDSMMEGSPSPRKIGRGRTVGMEDSLADDEVLQSQVADLAIDSTIVPSAARARRKQSVADEMSWEHVSSNGSDETAEPPTPIEPVENNVNARHIKPAPKARAQRKNPSNGTALPLNGATTPTKKNHTPAVAAPSTTMKRKARDMDFDSDLSSPSPSGDDDVATTRGGNALDESNPSFTTTSSDSTVRGKQARKSNPASDDEDFMDTPPPPGKARRQTTGGMGSAAGRSSARLRNQNGVGPSTIGRRISGEAEKKRTRQIARQRAASMDGSEDDDDEPVVVKKSGRKAAAAAPPSTPITVSAPRRNLRNGAAAAKVARVR